VSSERYRCHLRHPGKVTEVGSRDQKKRDEEVFMHDKSSCLLNPKRTQDGAFKGNTKGFGCWVIGKEVKRRLKLIDEGGNRYNELPAGAEDKKSWEGRQIV